MNRLSKRLIITPEQLQRLLGRDRVVSSKYAEGERSALKNALKTVGKVGPARAYAAYRTSQQRYLQQAAQEREAPLEIVIADSSPSARDRKEEASSQVDRRFKKRPVESVIETAASRKRGQRLRKSEEARLPSFFALDPLEEEISVPSSKDAGDAGEDDKNDERVKFPEELPPVQPRVRNPKTKPLKPTSSYSKLKSAFSPMKLRDRNGSASASSNSWLPYGGKK